MRNVRVFRALLGVDQRTVIEDIEFEEAEQSQGADDTDGAMLVVAQVRPRRRCLTALWPLRAAGTVV